MDRKKKSEKPASHSEIGILVEKEPAINLKVYSIDKTTISIM